MLRIVLLMLEGFRSYIQGFIFDFIDDLVIQVGDFQYLKKLEFLIYDNEGLKVGYLTLTQHPLTSNFSVISRAYFTNDTKWDDALPAFLNDLSSFVEAERVLVPVSDSEWL